MITRRFRLLLILTFLLTLSPALAQDNKFQGWCEQGGQRGLILGGPQTSNYVQESYPDCTVTVFDAGTANLSTIYSDSGGTAKSNPFTASSTGFWFFFADDATYDVQFSGGNIDTPFTITSLGASGGGSGSGGQFISVLSHGAVCDGITDDTAAIQSALDASSGGDTIYFPGGSCTSYLVTDTLVPQDNTVLYGSGYGSPTIKWGSTAKSTLFDLSNLTRVTIRNFRLEGNKDTSPSGSFINMDTSSWCVLENLVIVNPPGSSPVGSISIRGTATHNRVLNSEITGAEERAISISGPGGGLPGPNYNEVNGVRITDAGTVGIWIDHGAHRNIVTNCITESNGVELILIGPRGYENRIIGNHAEGIGDKGITSVGHHNTIVGNTTVGNKSDGISISGHHNTITGNVSLNNNQGDINAAGIGIFANFGGTGQFNIVNDNIIDDTQASPTQLHGIRVTSSGYTEWEEGQVIDASPGNFVWRYYGLNIYFATSSGTTGSTPPTHTTPLQIVSDGGVDWRFEQSFESIPEVAFNTVKDNNIGATASSGAPFFVFPTGTGQNTMSGGSHIVRKSDDTQTVNNSTTLVDDSELFVYLQENETVVFEAWIVHTGSSTADIKFGFDVPSGANISWGTVGPTLGADGTIQAPVAHVLSGQTTSVSSSSGNNGILVRGFVFMDGVSGYLKLRWAQNAADAVDTKVRHRSYLKVDRYIW